MTFGGLFGAVATAGGTPSRPELTAAQRLRAVSIAIEDATPGLGPLRRSAARPGFAAAFERLLDELQGAGLDPVALGVGSRDARGLRLPRRPRRALRRLRGGPRPARPRRRAPRRPRRDRAGCSATAPPGAGGRCSSTGSTT